MNNKMMYVLYGISFIIFAVPILISEEHYILPWSFGVIFGVLTVLFFQWYKSESNKCEIVK